MSRMAAQMLGLIFLGSFIFPGRGEAKQPQYEPPEIIRAEEAVYPVNVISGGTAILAVTISPEGEIADVKVIREAPGFTGEALRSIRNWKFSPAKLDGKPIRSVLPVAFSFSQPAVWWTRPPSK